MKQSRATIAKGPAREAPTGARGGRPLARCIDRIESTIIEMHEGRPSNIQRFLKPSGIHIRIASHADILQQVAIPIPSVYVHVITHFEVPI